MNMQLNASAFKPAPLLKTMGEIDADICDLRKRAEVLMSLIEAFESQMELVKTSRGLDVGDCGFELVAFQANEVRSGLQKLEDAMEEIADAS